MFRKTIPILFFIGFISCKNNNEVVVLPQPKVAPIVVDFGLVLNNFDVIQDTIKNGDSFGAILEKQNLGKREVHQVIETVKDSFDVKTIKVGKPYWLLRTKYASKKLQYFVYQKDRGHFTLIDFRDSLLVYNKSKPISYKQRTIAGRLDGSLYYTLNKYGIDANLANKITKMYAWSIDFFKSRRGDKFAITITERYIDDTIYDGVDSLKAAFFEYKGRKIYAFPYQISPRSRTDYYDENGKTLKNFFLKAPLKFINITSHYTKSRFHPVQQIWKAHNGTDYAAPQGTPIMTTASGVVEQTGYTAGNGNFVKVKHDRTYATQYLHMSKIVVRKGQTVKQGDIIGKVGSTGLATGPHVCYRFWKNGVQVDALKLKLPTSTPMDNNSKPAFNKYMLPLKNELDSIADLKFKM